MRVVDLTPAFAKTIAGWRYPGAYAIYDLTDTARLVPGTDFAVIDDQEHLVGHCALSVAKDSPGVLDLCFALDPRRMRQGRGHDFVGTVLRFANRSAAARDCVDVQVTLHDWNQVAIAICRDFGMREALGAHAVPGQPVRLRVAVRPAALLATTGH